MAKKTKKRGNRLGALFAWAFTFLPALLAAMTAFWNTREQGFLDTNGGGNGNGSKKSKRSRKRATA
jgi:hypothetical protein